MEGHHLPARPLGPDVLVPADHAHRAAEDPRGRHRGGRRGAAAARLERFDRRDGAAHLLCRILRRELLPGDRPLHTSPPLHTSVQGGVIWHGLVPREGEGALLSHPPPPLPHPPPAFLGVQVTFYICVAWIISYGNDPEGLNIARSDMLSAVLVSTMFALPANFIFGAWSDRHGRRGIYKLGAILTGLWAFAMFAMIDTGDWLLITIALSVAHILVSMMYGPQAALLAELFSTEVRYSGASLGYQLGAILGGGFAPIIATSLLVFAGSSMWVAGYIALANALTWVSINALKENHVKDLDSVA